MPPLLRLADTHVPTQVPALLCFDRSHRVLTNSSIQLAPHPTLCLPATPQQYLCWLCIATPGHGRRQLKVGASLCSGPPYVQWRGVVAINALKLGIGLEGQQAVGVGGGLCGVRRGWRHVS